MAVCFLLHFLASYLEWVLPTAVLFGARTFLVGLSRRDRLADPVGLNTNGKAMTLLGDGLR